MHKKILTWDNLRKKDFTGPSRCNLCEKSEETRSHLLNECPFSNNIWNWAYLVFKDQDIFSILNTIENWRSCFSNKPLINKAWNILPGIIYWSLWKEQNVRIFRGTHKPEEVVLSFIKQTIRESVASCKIDSPTDTPSCANLHIFFLLDIPLTLIPTVWRNFKMQGSEVLWSSLEISILKLNYDGAAKGNPGKSSFGGAFRNSQGEII